MEDDLIQEVEHEKFFEKEHTFLLQQQTREWDDAFQWCWRAIATPASSLSHSFSLSLSQIRPCTWAYCRIACTRASTIESEWNESSHDSRVFTAAEPLCFAAGLGRRTEPVRRLFCSGFIEFCLMLAVA